ncbi:MAG: hypothetical protein ACM3UT_05835, partial [Chloroflexota bacterium]
MLRKIIKILLIIIGSLFGLAILLVFAIWLGLFNGLIKDTIVSQANKNINGELRIGDLRGNLYSGFSVHNIVVFLESDTLLSTGEVEIDYSLLPLLRKELKIDLVSLKDVKLNAEQEQDSSWNFLRILKESPEADTTSSGSFDWKVSVNELSVRHLSAVISSVDTGTMIPRYAETGFRIRANIAGDTITARLDSLKIIIRHPSFTVREFTGNFSKRGNAFAWSDVKLQLINSIMNAEGTYSPAEKGQARADINISPLDFDDLRTLLPDLPVYGKPVILLHLQGNESKYDFNGSIKEQDQSIDLSGSLSDFKNNPSYFLNLILQNLDASHWTRDEKMKTRITGNFELSGKGFDHKQNELEVSGNFGIVTYDNYSLNDLIFNVSKNSGDVNGDLRSRTFDGDVSLSYDLSDVFGNPAYDIVASYNNINIGNLPGMDSIRSDLNGEIQVNGKGISPEKIVARVKLNSDSSFFNGEPLGNFILDAGYNRGDFNLALLNFGAPYFVLNAEGSGNLNRTGDFAFSLVPLDFSRLARIFGMPQISVGGKITGNLSGNQDSLRAFADIALDSLVYDTISIADVRSEVSLAFIEKAISAGLKLSTGQIHAGSYNLQSAEIKGEYTPDNAEADISLAVSDSLKAVFSGSVTGFENPIVRIKHLGIRYNDSEWSTPHDSAYVTLNKDDVTVNGFILSSGGQNIKAEGHLAFEGDEDMTLAINDLDLRSLPLLEFLPYEISGILSSTFSLTGTASKPVIGGTVSADGIEVNGFPIDSIRMGISYDNDLVQLKGKVLTGLYESVNLDLDVPIRVSLSDSIALLEDEPALRG